MCIFQRTKKKIDSDKDTNELEISPKREYLEIILQIILGPTNYTSLRMIG